MGAFGLLQQWMVNLKTWAVDNGPRMIFKFLLFLLILVVFKIGPLLAGLGAMGFIVGFALQDTLGNFASGMMILIYTVMAWPLL